MGSLFLVPSKVETLVHSFVTISWYHGVQEDQSISGHRAEGKKEETTAASSLSVALGGDQKAKPRLDPGCYVCVHTQNMLARTDRRIPDNMRMQEDQ